MKLLNVFALVIAIVTIASCKKENKTEVITDKYSSITDFFDKNAPSEQTYMLNGKTGGSFITRQGTRVSIPANAFGVDGQVKITFMDLYKKSDMLMADMGTMTILGQPLKSGGEFFINASIESDSGIIPLTLTGGKKIQIEQPAAATGGVDQVNKMEAFLVRKDSVKAKGWTPSPPNGNDTLAMVYNTTTSYIYNLYKFNTPASEGTWCNSDNSSYFSNYPQTSLTLEPESNFNIFDMQVFLVFKGISSMVHVYCDGTNFPYYFTPQGLECTVVAIGIKDNKVYSSFTPIKISSNMKVNLSMKETTTDAFKATLRALD